jgi:aspartyl aminopeptidase
MGINFSACGSTIGPILSSGLGIRTVDIGNPQWSMHSIRETCGTIDVLYSCQLFSHFFKEFRELDDSIEK